MVWTDEQRRIENFGIKPNRNLVLEVFQINGNKMYYSVKGVGTTD